VPKPKKTVAAEAAVELLRGVNVAAGFHTNLGRNRGAAVGRRVLALNLMREAEFPAATVLMGDARPSEDGGCLGSFRETSSLVVLLYGKATDIPAELERLEADAKEALCGADSLGGITGGPRHVSTIPYYQERENLDRGMVEVTFAVDHDWTAAAP
jgi:hypothetical protein